MAVDLVQIRKLAEAKENGDGGTEEFPAEARKEKVRQKRNATALITGSGFAA
jgi:hypothetical protein